jgi:hypothetical protein
MPGINLARGFTVQAPQAHRTTCAGNRMGLTRNDTAINRLNAVILRPSRPPTQTAAAVKAIVAAAVDEKPRTEKNHGPGIKRTRRAAAVDTGTEATRRPSLASGHRAATENTAEAH